MKTSTFLARYRFIAALVAIALPSTALRAQPVLYGLTETNSLLVLSGDGTTSIEGPVISGIGAGETAVAIDFRPFTSDLYALTRDSAGVGRIYTVDPALGMAVEVPLAGPTLMLAGSVGMNFNPAALGGTNALRVVTSERQNYRLVFGAAGATVNVDGALNVAGGASATNVVATAYSNNRAGLPGGAGTGGTVQYAIDSSTDRLYRVSPPNNGTLTNGLPLGLDIEGIASLDIVTGTDVALALLRAGGEKGLYRVDLATGSVTLMHALPPKLVSMAAPIPSTTPTPLVYGLASGNSLVRFSADGGLVVSGLDMSGLGANETVVAIDFRPLTGELYALSRDAANAGRLYTVNLGSGAVSPVTLAGPALAIAGSVGMDFNPAAANGNNALRIVTSEKQNYRLLFTTGNEATVNVDGALNVPGGATGTNVIATAYSNNRAGLPGAAGAGGTVQYAVDSDSDRLYRVIPPNNGTLTNGLPLGFDIGPVGGLDIATGNDRALGLFTVGGVSAVFQLDLVRGSAKPVRFLPSDIQDIAVPMPVVFPSTTVVGLTSANSLVTFATDGGPIVSGPGLTGLGTDETVVGIDFRPFTGELYAVARDSAGRGSLYTVNPTSGAATPVALTGAPMLVTGTVGMDFNPAAVGGTNALRIVTGDEHNFRLVFNASGATVNADAALNVPGGDVLTNITATAYSNNRAGLPGGGGAGGTVQYAIDSAEGLLYRVNPPNNGTLIARRRLGLDVRAVGGLDIATITDRALAVLDVAGAVGLYEIDLVSGAPALLRSLPANVTDLAIPTPVRIGSHLGAGAFAISGGVGPFGLMKSDVVDDVFCSVSATPQRTFAIGDGGSSGFYRIADLSATPSVRSSVSLSGAAERPTPVATGADGIGSLEISGNTLKVDISYRGLSGPAIAAHLHGPATSSVVGDVLVDFAPFNGGAFGTTGTLVGAIPISAEIKAAILSGQTYVNIHTAANPGGELRGQVASAVFETVLSGAAERPIDVATAGRGFGLFTVIGKELMFDIAYRGLSSAASAAHIHGPAASSGTAGVLIDLAPFISGTLGTLGRFAGKVALAPEQLAAIADGETYVNIHTGAFPGGEVRGQLRPVIASQSFSASLTGAAEQPTPVVTSGTGLAIVQLAGDTLTFRISYRDLSGPVVGAHFHGPAAATSSAGVQFDLAPFHKGPYAAEGMFVGSVTLAPEQKTALLEGRFYVNLHTGANPNGEVRGQMLPVIDGLVR